MSKSQLKRLSAQVPEIANLQAELATAKELERAALWLYRATKTMAGADFLRPDETCTCEWCRARRNFIKACVKKRGKP